MLPNFIGIGAPKAGTTWLARCLSEHPQVFVAAVKEVVFFDYGTIEGRLDEYETHFQRANGAAAVGEFTTRYLASNRPPSRIRAMLPDVRLIVSLRNPIDQVYSHYWHLLRQNFHSWGTGNLPRNFEEALESQQEQLWASAFYYRHLSRWLEHFDRQQLLILFYDDICQRPDEVLRQTYSFLQVDSSFVPPSVRTKNSGTRKGTSPRNRLLGRVHSYVYDRLNRRVYHPLKGFIGVRRADGLKRLLGVRRVMEGLFFRTGYPPMKSRTRSRLANHFADEVKSLSQLTGRDLSHWV